MVDPKPKEESVPDPKAKGKKPAAAAAPEEEQVGPEFDAIKEVGLKLKEIRETLTKQEGGNDEPAEGEEAPAPKEKRRVLVEEVDD